MPYVATADRHPQLTPQTPGELTYRIQQLLDEYLDDRIESRGRLSYEHLAGCLGALDGARLDFNQRVVQPYETRKRAENGDVWSNRVLDHVIGKEGP